MLTLILQRKSNILFNRIYSRLKKYVIFDMIIFSLNIIFYSIHPRIYLFSLNETGDYIRDIKL